jgi:hypothetical protein
VVTGVKFEVKPIKFGEIERAAVMMDCSIELTLVDSQKLVLKAEDEEANLLWFTQLQNLQKRPRIILQKTQGKRSFKIIRPSRPKRRRCPSVEYTDEVPDLPTFEIQPKFKTFAHTP